MLMAAQCFFYNAIFFTYALVLTTFYNVPHQEVGWCVFPFALGNVLGPLLLGPVLIANGAREQTIAWMIVFFFASAAASAAYLTVSEIFSVEIRALAIAAFYAFGTALGGVAAPALFGALIATHTRGMVLVGYLFGATLMLAAAAAEARFGVAAEGKSLESVAQPLSSEGE